LEVRIVRAGAAVVTIAVALRDPSDFKQVPRVQQRLEAEERELLAGSDPWSARLQRVEPERQRDVIDLSHGRLHRIQRSALLAGPEDLREFFRDTGVGVTYAEGSEWAELTLTPGRPSRATAAQRQHLSSGLEAFAANLAAYAAATKRLYDHLDANPERARACLAAIVAESAAEEELTGDEPELVADVNEAIGEMGEILAPAEDEPFTLDEISRLVYDPFPASMRVSVPGTIVEREGFPGELTSELKIPALSIWSAFELLEGRWFSPDPALALWRHDAAKTRKPFDLEGFLALPRRASIAPTEGDARRAIAAQLEPAGVYRVRWTVSASDDDASELTALPEP